MRFVIALLCFWIGGCALTTPAPGGPLRAGTYSQLQPSWAVAYGPASMKVDGMPVSGTVQSRNIGSGFIDPLPNPVPLAVGVRQALGAHLELSGDVGWVDSGVGLRLAIPWLAGAEPLVLSAGARSGRVSFFADESYEGRVSLEAYPIIEEAGVRSLRLLLSAGIAAGTFVHELLLPESFRSDSDAPSGPPRARVLRPEIRLQTSVGIFLSNEHGAVAVALSPWVLLGQDDPTSLICVECDGDRVISDYAQTWGLALSITPSVGSDFLH